MFQDRKSIFFVLFSFVVLATGLFITQEFETMGPWGPAAKKLLTDLSVRLNETTGDRRAGAFLSQRVSLAIQRRNAASILGTMSRGDAPDSLIQDECPQNEEYLLCGSACPLNCSSVTPANCSADCVEGCFCKLGYLRTDNGTCVAAEKCAADTICGPNEEFLTCGTLCPLTCTSPDPVACGLACSVGCFCKDGFVRDVTTNSCVTLDQCPIEECLNPDEVYDICNAGCEPSCSDPEPICNKICRAGCVCAPGLLRDVTGACVSVDKCAQSGNLSSNNGTSRSHGLLKKYMEVIESILNVSGKA